MDTQEQLPTMTMTKWTCNERSIQKRVHKSDTTSRDQYSTESNTGPKFPRPHYLSAGRTTYPGVALLGTCLACYMLPAIATGTTAHSGCEPSGHNNCFEVLKPPSKLNLKVSVMLPWQLTGLLRKIRTA
jgi:hypothetical protein